MCIHTGFNTENAVIRLKGKRGNKSNRDNMSNTSNKVYVRADIIIIIMITVQNS